MPATSKNIQALYNDLRSHYSSAHQQMQREDRAYQKHFAGLVDVPYEVRIFESSTAANIVDGFRNQIRTDEPTVVYRPSGSSVAAAKQAILMQKWGYAMLRKERLMSVLDPNLQLGFDLLLRGAACKKILVNVDEIMEKAPKRGSVKFKDWEARALTSWPFITQAIDPLSIFPAVGSKKPHQYIIERQTRFAGDIMEQYPNWQNPDEIKRETRPVEWLEYWSRTSYAVEADGVSVFERENPYGIVPYIFEWSGLGRRHDDSDPRHLAVGILTSILGELEEEVRLKTAISIQTQMHVFPPILTIEDPVKVAKQFGVGPGKVIQHMPGNPPVYMQYPAPNENMYRFLDVIQENIARVHSKSLSGGRDGGVRFGVLQAQMIGQALTTIAPVLGTLDQMGTQTLNMMSHMTRSMDLTMMIHGTQEGGDASSMVHGSDFEHQNFDVTWEAIDPAENDRALLVGESMRRNGDISRRTLWTKYAKHVVEDPDLEDDLLLEEGLMQQLLESGQLSMAVLSEDVQEQMREKQEEAIEGAREMLPSTGDGTQNRQQDAVSEVAQTRASQLEQIAGRPGQSSIPADIAQAGMANASPSRAGIPRS